MSFVRIVSQILPMNCQDSNASHLTSPNEFGEMSAVQFMRFDDSPNTTFLSEVTLCKESIVPDAQDPDMAAAEIFEYMQGLECLESGIDVDKENLPLPAPNESFFNVCSASSLDDNRSNMLISFPLKISREALATFGNSNTSFQPSLQGMSNEKILEGPSHDNMLSKPDCFKTNAAKETVEMDVDFSAADEQSYVNEPDFLNYITVEKEPISNSAISMLSSKSSDSFVSDSSLQMCSLKRNKKSRTNFSDENLHLRNYGYSSLDDNLENTFVDFNNTNKHLSVENMHVHEEHASNFKDTEVRKLPLPSFNELKRESIFSLPMHVPFENSEISSLEAFALSCPPLMPEAKTVCSSQRHINLVTSVQDVDAVPLAEFESSETGPLEIIFNSDKESSLPSTSEARPICLPQSNLSSVTYGQDIIVPQAELESLKTGPLENIPNHNKQSSSLNICNNTEDSELAINEDMDMVLSPNIPLPNDQNELEHNIGHMSEKLCFFNKEFNFELWFNNNTCTLCGYIMRSWNILYAKKHLISHRNAKNFKCRICKKLFDAPSGLQAHMQEHGFSLPFIKCNICPKKFTKIRAFDDHMSSHGCKPSYDCDICKKSFVSKSNLQRHKLRHTDMPQHKKIKTKSSTISDNINLKKTSDDNFGTPKTVSPNSNQESNLFQSPITNSKEMKHTCITCGMVFECSDHLINHINVQHTEDIPNAGTRFEKESGNLNEASFHSEESLQSDITKSIIETYCCVICGMMLEFSHQLKKHIDMYHSEGSGNANSEVRFENQVKAHGHSKEQQSFQNKAMHSIFNGHSCSFCGMMFLTLHDLNNHIVMNHIEPNEISGNASYDESFKNLCKTSTQSKEELSFKNKTSIVKGHSCTFCGTMFQFLHDLNNHIYMHHNKSSHVSSNPSFETSSQNQSKVPTYTKEEQFFQNKTTHPIIKKHCCAVCGIMFPFLNDLNKHIDMYHIKHREIVSGGESSEESFENQGKAPTHSKQEQSLNDETSIKANSCAVCGMMFQFIHDLYNHIDMYHIESSNISGNASCEERLENQDQTQTHFNEEQSFQNKTTHYY